jgi:hypothetical protein
MTFLANEQTRMSSSQSSPDDLTSGWCVLESCDRPFIFALRVKSQTDLPTRSASGLDLFEGRKHGKMSYDYATCRVCALEMWYLQVLCRGGLRKYTPSLMHAVSLIVDGCLTILQRAIRICRFDVMMHAIGSVVQKVEKVHTRITVNPCGCICVSLGLVDDASKVHESSRWKISDGKPFVPA